MNSLASGANLSAKWGKDAKERAMLGHIEVNDAVRLELLNLCFKDAMSMLSPLVDGYVPSNLDI